MPVSLSKPKILDFHSKWCNPTSTRVMDVLHGVSLLAVLATAIWNMVLTIQGNATISAMRPIFITTLVSAILKIPSQVCAAHGRLGGWMSLIGSIVTVVITAILVGYLTWDPIYKDDHMEDVCITEPISKKQWHARLETSKLNNNGHTNACGNQGELGAVQALPQKGPIPARQLYRATFNPGHWAPVLMM